MKTELNDPPAEFCEWWNPSRRDKESGADIGGHPEAERVWARKDPGRWVHRTYGSNARVAWNGEQYRNEYFRWIMAGRPEREECRMIAASLHVQKASWSKLKGILSRIGKPFPKPDPFDHDSPPKGAQPQY